MSGKATGQVWELKLPLPQLVVLMALADRADQFGNNIYPGMSLVAWMTGYSERQVRRVVKELVDSGLLVKVKDRPGKTSVYRIDFAKGVQKSPFKEDMTPDIAVTPDIAMSPLTSHGKNETPTPDTPSLNLPTNGIRDERLKGEDARADVTPVPATASKELQTGSISKTPPPPNSARPSAPGRPRHKLAVYGGQDTYADGGFIDAGTPDFLDACNGIFYAWLDVLEELGRRPDTSLTTLWEKNRDAIKSLAQNRRTPEQIAAYVRYVYSDKYRDDFYRRNPSPITLQAVTGSIAGWLNSQKPKQTIPFEERQPLYPPRQQFSEEAKERIRQMRREALQ